MKRRRVLFWFSAGLFGLGESLGVESLDRLAAAAMNFRGSGSARPPGQGSVAASGKNFGPTPSKSSPNYSHNIIPSGPAVDVPDDPAYRQTIDPKRVARHGRPPSRWLRSLETDELREWLKTVSPPQTGVVGNQFALHLTRDHLFRAEQLVGLAAGELAKLHSAAHAGY